MADTTMHTAAQAAPAAAASSSSSGAAAPASASSTLLQPPNYHLVSSTPAHTRPIAALKFSHDGRFLASAGADAALRIYSVVEGEAQSVPSAAGGGATLSRPTPILQPYAEVLGAHECGINDLVFTHDGRHVLTASDDKTIIVWDLLALDHTGSAGAVGVGVGGSTGAPVAPALPTLRPLRSYRGHTSYVFCLAVSTLNNLLVSGSYDETVRIWDLKNAKMLRLIKAHSDPVSAVDFNRDGTLIVSSSYDGLCRVWETSSGRCLKTIYNEKTPPVHCLKTYSSPSEYSNSKFCVSSSFSTLHTDQHIVCGSEDGAVVFWGVVSAKVVARLEAHGSSNNATTATAATTHVTPAAAARKETTGKDGQLQAREPVLCVACHPTLPILASAPMEPPFAILMWAHAQ